MRDTATRHLVLSGVRNRMHLVYVTSYLRHLVDQDEVVDLTLLGTGTALGRPRVSVAEAAETLGTGPQVRLVTDPDWSRPRTTGRTELVSVGAPATKALARMTARAGGRRPWTVVTDEGLSSYGTLRTRRAAYLREGGRDPHATVRATVVAGAARLLTDERWMLHRRTAGAWTLHEGVASEIRRRLQGEPPPAGTAVYLTQPWPFLRIMSREDYLRHLVEVTAACRAAGLALAIRPHPADDLDPGVAAELGLQVQEGDGPAELSRAVAGASVVLGASSTALLNVAAVHGTPSVRVLPAQVALLERGLSPEQASLQQHYLGSPTPPRDLVEALSRVRRAP